MTVYPGISLFLREKRTSCGAGCPLLRMRQNYRYSAKYIKKLKILHVKHKNNPLIYKENLYRIDISDKTNDKK